MSNRTDEVLCDFCNRNYSDSDAQGGFLFARKATCPACAPRIEAKAAEYGETSQIIDRAGPGETFKAAVRRWRGG